MAHAQSPSYDISPLGNMCVRQTTNKPVPLRPSFFCHQPEGPLGGGSKLLEVATKHWPSRAALEMGNRASASKHVLEKCAPGYWIKGNNFEREVLSFNTHYQVY